MHNLQRDILVLIKNELMSQQAIEHEVKCLNGILQYTEMPYRFCIAHELVARNYITSNHEKIIKATRQAQLKPFFFLINKN
ncbi:MAG TPA: hypothetical protein VET23_10425 [Chitinophagaceae bacterium]|nr:hypothetical protein [Chitinophagaceae bacterium]